MLPLLPPMVSLRATKTFQNRKLSHTCPVFEAPQWLCSTARLIFTIHDLQGSPPVTSHLPSSLHASSLAFLAVLICDAPSHHGSLFLLLSRKMIVH